MNASEICFASDTVPTPAGLTHSCSLPSWVCLWAIMRLQRRETPRPRLAPRRQCQAPAARRLPVLPPVSALLLVVVQVLQLLLSSRGWRSGKSEVFLI
jgi:hypothetical protein